MIDMIDEWLIYIDDMIIYIDIEMIDDNIVIDRDREIDR